VGERIEPKAAPFTMEGGRQIALLFFELTVASAFLDR